MLLSVVVIGALPAPCHLSAAVVFLGNVQYGLSHKAFSIPSLSRLSLSHFCR